MKRRVLIAVSLAGLCVCTAQADESKVTVATPHVELDATTIRSSTELPSVMAVVPWKKALPADLGGRPDRSLVDSLLRPLDPDVFRREVKFYEQLFVASTSASADTDKPKRERK